MTESSRIVVLVGSLRADSLNRRIAEALRDQAPDGVVVEIADGLHELPFYNEDIDIDQVPAAAQALRALVAGADALVAGLPLQAANGASARVTRAIPGWSFMGREY